MAVAAFAPFPWSQYIFPLLLLLPPPTCLTIPWVCPVLAGLCLPCLLPPTSWATTVTSGGEQKGQNGRPTLPQRAHIRVCIRPSSEGKIWDYSLILPTWLMVNVFRNRGGTSPSRPPSTMCSTAVERGQWTLLWANNTPQAYQSTKGSRRHDPGIQGPHRHT